MVRININPRHSNSFYDCHEWWRDFVFDNISKDIPLKERDLEFRSHGIINVDDGYARFDSQESFNIFVLKFVK